MNSGIAIQRSAVPGGGSYMRESTRLARGHALYDAQLRALAGLDVEAQLREQRERPTQEVIATREAHHHALQGALKRACPGWFGGDVIQQDHTTARAQDAMHLGQRAPIVGHAAQRKRADDRVEAGIGERQRVRVAQPQVNRTP